MSDSISRPPSKLTVVETVYHQAYGGQARSVVSNFSRTLNSDEEVYQRRMDLTPEWQALDCGWIKSCSMLLIENPPLRLQRVPTLEEAVENSKKVVEVSFLSANGIIIFPGESARFTPTRPQELLLRAQVPLRCRITLFPG